MVRFHQASFMLAKSYLELGLAYASKHVALAASFSAMHSDDPAVIRALPTMVFGPLPQAEVRIVFSQRLGLYTFTGR